MLRSDQTNHAATPKVTAPKAAPTNRRRSGTVRRADPKIATTASMRAAIQSAYQSVVSPSDQSSAPSTPRRRNASPKQATEAIPARTASLSVGIGRVLNGHLVARLQLRIVTIGAALTARTYREAVVSPARGAGRSAAKRRTPGNRGLRGLAFTARGARPAGRVSRAACSSCGPNRPNRVLSGEARTGHAFERWRGKPPASPSVITGACQRLAVLLTAG